VNSRCAILTGGNRRWGGSAGDRHKQMKENAILKIQSIVFDFDGTLAELRIDFAEMKRRLSELAESYSLAKVPAPFLPVLEWLAWLENGLRKANGACSDDFRKRALAIIAGMEMDAARKGSLFSFTRPLLANMIERNIKTAVITRNCDAAVRQVFPDILDYCHCFLARDHVPSPKPDPAHLIRALEVIEAGTATALMVGDHSIDIETGRAAGVLTAGVCSGNVAREDLVRAGADWVARDCEELVDILTREGLLR